MHGSGTLLISSIGTGTTTDQGTGARFSGTGSDFTGTIVIGPNVKGEITSAVAGPASPIGTGNLIMTGGTVTGALAGTYSELNLRNNLANGTSIFGNNLSIAGTGAIVLNPLNGSATTTLTSILGTATIANGQTLAIDKNSAGVNFVQFQNVVLTGGAATFQPVTNGGGWSGTAGLIVGAVSETVPGSSVTMNGLGTFIMAGNNTYTGGTNVQSGTLISNTNLSNGTLAITGGTTRVAAKAASNDPTGVTIVPAVSISSGSLDLTNNAMVVDYTGASPFSTIQSQIVSGYASGAWTGPGINSSSAATAFTTAHPTALGYAEATAIGITGTGTFAGHSVDSTSVLVRYTLAGDANLDGKVNALDFNALATNFGTGSGKPWTNGDFNYDGQVTTADFTAMAQNFGAPLADAPLAPVLGTLVPEPASLGLLSLAALLVMRRRRRGS